MRSIKEIIADAGGPKKIASACAKTRWPITSKVVYAWPDIGIPERHWAVIVRLAKSSAEELHRANNRARADRPKSGAARAVA